jgi:hypothetical protein
MKIRPLGAELFHADKRTDGHGDMTKLIAAFRNFTDTLKNYYLPHRTHTASITKTSRLTLFRKRIAAKKYLRNSLACCLKIWAG